MSLWQNKISALTGIGLTAAALAVPIGLLIYEQIDGSAAFGYNRAVINATWAVLVVIVAIRLLIALISARRAYEAQRRLRDEMSFLALHDPLTGLANRVLFGQELEAALGADPDHTLGLFLDLDDFKGINDSLGHATGDEVLQVVATRLLSAIRPGDLVARLSGDEFVVLFRGVTTEGVDPIAARVLGAFASHISVAGRPLAVTASLGLARGGEGIDGPELLRRADIAMYVAKGRGGNSIESFAPTRHGSVLERLSLRSELTRALEQGEFLVHYQPVYELADNGLAGVEALVRWAHPTRGLLPMAQFRDLIEENALMLPLGRLVIEKACAQARTWLDAGKSELLPVRINLSARELASATLLSDIAAACEANHLESKALLFEIAEGALADMPLARKVTEALSAAGFSLSLDDFGTGWASLTCLSVLPFSEVKVDPAFMADLDEPKRRLLLCDLTKLVKSLGVIPAIEILEQDGAAAYMCELGFVRGQGFALTAPMGPDELEAHLGL